jgi:hypothetical protein
MRTNHSEKTLLGSSGERTTRKPPECPRIVSQRSRICDKGSMKLALMLFVALSGFAQTANDRGRQIVNEALAALGGPKYLAIQDRVESGRAYSFYHEQLSGLSFATIYTRYLAPSQPAVPGQLLLDERQSFGKHEKYGSTLFLGGKGSQITFRGIRPIPKESAERYRDSTLHSFFYILRERLDEPGMVFEDRGSDIAENEPVRIVAITDSDNRTVTVYFHHLSKLPVRQVYYRRDSKTGDRDEEISLFTKYRDIGGGVMWPYAVQRMRNGDRIFQMFAQTVEVNKNLPSSLFTLPAGLPMLKPME